MLYNNKLKNQPTKNAPHCHHHCNHIAHNHDHDFNVHDVNQSASLSNHASNDSHDSCCSHEGHSCGGEHTESPPEEPDRRSDSQNSNEPQITWKVEGMDCASCARKIENALKTIPNITHSRIIFSTEKLVVTASKVTPSLIKEIESKVTELGFKIISEQAKQHTHSHNHNLDKKAFIPLILLGVLIVVSYITLLINKPLGEYAFIATAIVGIIPIVKQAITIARFGSLFTIESLMSISAIGALFIGASEEATMVIFLFMIGEMLEGVASNKAKKGISSLVELMPDETVIIENGQRKTVSSKSLRPDDIIEISSGGRLPADVILQSEHAIIDESALTGESIPVDYQAGAKIMAGSLIVDKTVQFKVISQPGQNAVDRILQLIEDAEERKAPIERFVDRFSRYYTPAITALALLVIVIPPLVTNDDWYTWIYRGLTLLLIGCPCALVISTPAAITSGLSSAAKQGVLIKGGAALENLGSIKTIAFDKTGTLTEGKPKVTDILPNKISIEQLLSTAAAIESGSHHPLAKAIVDKVKQLQLPTEEAVQRETMAGIGIKGKLNNQQIYIVSPNKVSHINIDIDQAWMTQITQLEEDGKTVVLVTTDSTLLGAIALQDTLREDAIEAITQLHSLGLKTVMLTGDNKRAAKAIASQLDIDHRAELLPADKLKEIEKINETSPTAMIGDGINDSPAMKAATVGIAMGSGTDVALETADAALTKNSLLSVPKLIRLTRATNSNIRQNITIALGVKAVFLVTSLFGITGLWIAVLADSGTTAIVTANALRLLRKR